MPFPNLLLSLLLLNGPVVAEIPAGRYRLIGEQDVASELLLGPEGSFRYYLSAGALDEQGRGRWTLDGKTIRLNSDPKPVPPVFSLAKATRSGASPLTIKVGWPDGRGIAGVDFRIGFDSGDAVTGYTQEDGWSLPSEEKRAPRWIELAVPMHGQTSPRFPIDIQKANSLSFTLTPNDMGVVDFDNLLLDVEPGRLVMHRYGGLMTYVGVERSK